MHLDYDWLLCVTQNLEDLQDVVPSDLHLVRPETYQEIVNTKLAISLQIRYLNISLVTTIRFGDKNVELDQEGPELADLCDLTCNNLIGKDSETGEESREQ